MFQQFTATSLTDGQINSYDLVLVLFAFLCFTTTNIMLQKLSNNVISPASTVFLSINLFFIHRYRERWETEKDLEGGRSASATHKTKEEEEKTHQQ